LSLEVESEALQVAHAHDDRFATNLGESLEVVASYAARRDDGYSQSTDPFVQIEIRSSQRAVSIHRGDVKSAHAHGQASFKRLVKSEWRVSHPAANGEAAFFDVEGDDQALAEGLYEQPQADVVLPELGSDHDACGAGDQGITGGL
jgi:hypothetical protein